MSDDIRPGQLWRSKTSGVVIEIGKRWSGNGHWNTRKLSSRSTRGARKSHRIHEGTLRKFYERVRDDAAREAGR